MLLSNNSSRRSNARTTPAVLNRLGTLLRLHRARVSPTARRRRRSSTSLLPWPPLFPLCKHRRVARLDRDRPLYSRSRRLRRARLYRLRLPNPLLPFPLIFLIFNHRREDPYSGTVSYHLRLEELCLRLTTSFLMARHHCRYLKGLHRLVLLLPQRCRGTSVPASPSSLLIAVSLLPTRRLPRLVLHRRRVPCLLARRALWVRDLQAPVGGCPYLILGLSLDRLRLSRVHRARATRPGRCRPVGGHPVPRVCLGRRRSLRTTTRSCQRHGGGRRTGR